MADNSKQRKDVKYPDMAELSDADKADVILTINNHEDWGASSFNLTTNEGTALDLRKKPNGQWVIW